MSEKRASLADVIIALVAFTFIKLNLTERGNNKISLTNLMVFVCIVKVAMSPVISIPEIGALFLSVLNYAHKRIESNKASKEERSKLPDSSSVLEEIEKLKAIVDEQSKVLESQGKVVEEAKSIMTAQKLGASQKRGQL